MKRGRAPTAELTYDKIYYVNYLIPCDIATIATFVITKFRIVLILYALFIYI